MLLRRLYLFALLFIGLVRKRPGRDIRIRGRPFDPLYFLITLVNSTLAVSSASDNAQTAGTIPLSIPSPHLPLLKYQQGSYQTRHISFLSYQVYRQSLSLVSSPPSHRRHPFKQKLQGSKSLLQLQRNSRLAHLRLHLQEHLRLFPLRVEVGLPSTLGHHALAHQPEALGHLTQREVLLHPAQFALLVSR